MPSSSSRPKRPFILMLVLTVAILSGLVNFLEAFAAPFVFDEQMRIVIGTIVVSGFAVGYALWILIGITQERFRDRLPISLYLWFLLFLYPLTNVLKKNGLYVPGPHFTNEELDAAVVLDLLRYAILILLIIWTSWSEALEAYFVRNRR